MTDRDLTTIRYELGDTFGDLVAAALASQYTADEVEARYAENGDELYADTGRHPTPQCTAAMDRILTTIRGCQRPADRALADRVRALADQVEAGTYAPPTRPAGYRGLVVHTAVHDLVCTVRVATPQDTAPPVGHCAACGLSTPIGTEPGDIMPPDPAEVAEALGDIG